MKRRPKPPLFLALASRPPLVAAELGLTACWSAHAAPAEAEAKLVTQQLVGGFAAPDSSLDGVGALVVTYQDQFSSYTDVVCSGTLIDEDTVLTARHCLDSVRWNPPGGSVAFVVICRALIREDAAPLRRQSQHRTQSDAMLVTKSSSSRAYRAAKPWAARLGLNGLLKDARASLNRNRFWL